MVETYIYSLFKIAERLETLDSNGWVEGAALREIAVYLIKQEEENNVCTKT